MDIQSGPKGGYPTYSSVIGALEVRLTAHAKPINGKDQNITGQSLGPLKDISSSSSRVESGSDRGAGAVEFTTSKLLGFSSSGRTRF